MKSEELLNLSVLDIATKVRGGEITPIELVNACFAQIDNRDGKVTAWQATIKESALKRAEQLGKEIEDGKIRSLFHGIPIGIKDIIDVEGLPTQHNCRAFQDAPAAPKNATIVSKLEDLGAIIIGKTHTAELAYFDPSPTKNPYNIEYTPGGSSSGSAAAVAARMIPISVGTQTNASVARPAAYNGVGGFRPTIQQLSLDGILSFSPSFDSLGFFGKTFKEAALGYITVKEEYENQITHDQKEEKHLKIGVVTDPFYDKATADVKEVMKEVENQLKEAGHDLVNVPSFAPFSKLIQLQGEIMAYEAAQIHSDLVAEREDQLGDKFCELIKNAQKIPQADYEENIKSLEKIREEANDFFAPYDLLLVPPTDCPAPKDLTTTGDPAFTTPWTVIGSPLATIPVKLNDEGLPLAVMFTSAQHTDEQLIEYAVQLEELIGKIPAPQL